MLLARMDLQDFGNDIIHNLKGNNEVYIIYNNICLVLVVSGCSPYTSPTKEYDPEQDVKYEIWNVLPTEVVQREIYKMVFI
jgi:hypothetical protein